MINYCLFAGCEQTFLPNQSLHSSRGSVQEDGNESSHLQDVFIIIQFIAENILSTKMIVQASWLKLWIITHYKDIFRKDNPQVKPGLQGKTEEILWQRNLESIIGLDSVSEFSFWMCSYDRNRIRTGAVKKGQLRENSSAFWQKTDFWAY